MLRFFDSFDHYASADKATKWTQYGTNTGTGAITIAAVGARSTNGMKLASATTSGSGRFSTVLATSGATCIVGFRFRSVTAFAILQQTTNSEVGAPNGLGAGDGNILFSCRNASTTLWWARINTNGTISIYRGTTLLGSTSSALTQNVFQYVEIKVLLHASAGTVEVRFDGSSTPVLNLTGQNTTNTGAVVWDEFRFGTLQRDSVAGADEWNIDDLYVADGVGSGASVFDFVGDAIAAVYRPTSNGATRDYTPSTGTDDYTVTDEAEANGDTDYLSAAVVDDVVTMGYENVPTGRTIVAVQVVAQARKIDGGTAGHKAVARIGGVDYAGDEAALSTSYKFERQIYEEDPSTAAAWTVSNFNGAEIGAKKSA